MSRPSVGRSQYWYTLGLGRGCLAQMVGEIMVSVVRNGQQAFPLLETSEGLGLGDLLTCTGRPTPCGRGNWGRGRSGS